MVVQGHADKTLAGILENYAFLFLDPNDQKLLHQQKTWTAIFLLYVNT